MTSTIPAETVSLVSQLTTVQEQKETLQKRVHLYERKLEMMREAMTTLVEEEKNLESVLVDPPSVDNSPHVSALSSVDGKLGGVDQSQLTELVKTLLQQQSSVPSAQPSPLQAPVSGNSIYTFPSGPLPAANNTIAPILSPTSNSGRAVPKVSPTSGPAPSLSIRRRR